MYGGEIYGNKAKRFGGAIFLNGTLQSKKGGTVNLYGGTISDNSAQCGGAIYSQYGGTVDGCDGSEDGDCDGGEASYFNKEVCDTCHAEYGRPLQAFTAKRRNTAKTKNQ